jgi:hypothetical protein
MQKRDAGLALTGTCAVITATGGIGPWWAQVATALAGAVCLYLAKPAGPSTAMDAVQRGGLGE